MDERPTSGVENPSLEYEQRISFVSRKQYRRLMALTLLNTILLAGFIVGPSIGPMVKSQWEQFQARREQRRAEQQRAAAVAAAKAYVPPADLVVYEERPDEAAKLLAEKPSLYRIIPDAKIIYFTPRPWQVPVRLKELPVTPWNARARDMAPAAFLGALKGPSGQQRLVIVSVEARLSIDQATELEERQRRLFHLTFRRTLFAEPIANDGRGRVVTTLTLDRPFFSRSSVIWNKGSSGWEQGQVQFDPHGLFRIYAGRVDPTDASHFTIDYEIDGKRGTIDGWMREDDVVEFRPRDGAIVERSPDGRQATWDPYASPPTTRP